MRARLIALALFVGGWLGIGGSLGAGCASEEGPSSAGTPTGSDGGTGGHAGGTATGGAPVDAGLDAGDATDGGSGGSEDAGVDAADCPEPIVFAWSGHVFTPTPADPVFRKDFGLPGGLMLRKVELDITFQAVSMARIVAMLESTWSAVGQRAPD